MAQQDDRYCVSCDSCEGCNSCELCDDGCQVTCNSKQTLCILNCQTYSDINEEDFSWGSCTSSGQIMGIGYFDQNDWDSIIDYINEACSAGTLESTGGLLDSSDKNDVAPFKASEFNRVSRKIGGTTVQRHGIIYGRYFSNLENAASSARISSAACDVCNAGCDGGCNICQMCNAGCNSGCNGTAQRTRRTSCESCNVCEADGEENTK